MYYGHSRNAAGHRQGLPEHIHAVAELAASFADAFGSGPLAYQVGLWHDLGKFNPAFQEYLLACEADPGAKGHGPDHKAAGAQMAAQRLGPTAQLIQGHHGGLRSKTDLQQWLAERRKDPALTAALDIAQSVLPELQPPARVVPPAYVRQPLEAELFLRMVFSALVDADYLDTEAHFTPSRTAGRGSQVTLATLWERFERAQGRLVSGCTPVVQEARTAIYEACLEAATQPPGLFRLTVPTGGGKTRSGLAFALRHALRHGHRRVITVVPFISITEQTAAVYRECLEGDESGAAAAPVVLEHHSGVDEAEHADDDFHARQVWRRLGAENWDAPVIVTTGVQFFESLFARSTSRCRKLHRLAGSVIILDEVQTLPPRLLTPILDALNQLCQNYGATVVLSTATQPAFSCIPVFARTPAREIVPRPERFFQSLRRVRYEWRLDPALEWAEVAALVGAAPSALVVVNTKKDALALLDALDDPEALHLSTLLCGAHRGQVIRLVKARLAAGLPCRVVSTQVVEAGVDLDFPLVLRALGPLDSIIQAAGRCNREGRLSYGRVIVFRPADGGIPPGSYRTATGVTAGLLARGPADLDDPAVAAQYFQNLFGLLDKDAQEIQKYRAAFDYPEVAARFRMIAEETESVVITSYGDEEQQAIVHAALARLRAGTPDTRRVLRQLQPYIVAVRARQARDYTQRGWITPITEGVGEWHGRYDATRGLVADDPGPEVFVL